MEALEPVLKQKFWILLGMGIIMTFAGWWVATGQILASITDRKNKIEAAEKSIPTSEVPNEVWTKRLSEVNGKQESSIKSTRLGLWKRQQEKMVLPEGLPQVAFEEKLQNEERELFRDAYQQEVRRVWKTLNPMDMDGTGVVNYPLPAMFKLMNQKPWTRSPPKSEVIWEVMEDLWLLEGLFQSIAEANGGPEAGRPEASVHQIDILELRGGGEKLATASSDGGGNDGLMSGFGGPAGMGMGMRGAGGTDMAGMAGGGSAAVPTVSAEFDPREEFGDDGAGAGAGGGRGGGGGGGGGAPMGMMGGMAMMQGAMGGMEDSVSSAPAETVIKRYVKSDESLPYKTRGFYLSVKMDHRKIPQFIAQLTANEKSVWPVEILRVQMSRLHEDDSSFGGGGYPGGGGMRMGGGYPGATGAGPMGPGGPMSALGGRRDEDDAFDSFTNQRSFGTSGNAANSMQNMQRMKEVQESLDIALKDPYMAQVTLCGVFTMYRKVEEPKEEPAPDSTSAPAETETADGANNSEDPNSSEAATIENAGPEMSDPASSTEGTAEADAAPATEASLDPVDNVNPGATEGAGDDSSPPETDAGTKPENEQK